MKSNKNDTNYLIQLATKRLETTMIGALARFETSFGYLWGHHKDYNEPLSDKEIYFENIWQDLRNNILNHGNSQIRALQNDIQTYTNDKTSIKFNYKLNVHTKEDTE